MTLTYVVSDKSSCSCDTRRNFNIRFATKQEIQIRHWLENASFIPYTLNQLGSLFEKCTTQNHKGSSVLRLLALSVHPWALLPGARCDVCLPRELQLTPIKATEDESAMMQRQHPKIILENKAKASLHSPEHKAAAACTAGSWQSHRRATSLSCLVSPSAASLAPKYCLCSRGRRSSPTAWRAAL